MEDRVGAALRIGIRTTLHGKPHTLIKTNSLFILLVYIDTGTSEPRDGMPQHTAADPPPPVGRVYEKHLYISIFRAQKSQYTSGGIPCRRQPDSREITRQKGFI